MECHSFPTLCECLRDMRPAACARVSRASIPASAPLLVGEGARYRHRPGPSPAIRTRLGGGSDFFNCLFHFLLGALAGVAILLLEQADDLFGIAIRLFQVIIGEFAPPLLDLAAHFLPLAFENILVHFDPLNPSEKL